MGIGKLESFLENHIEGFFNKKFSSDLEPVELSKALEKEIAETAGSDHLVFRCADSAVSGGPAEAGRQHV